MEARGAELKTGIIVVLASLVFLALLFYATGEDLWGERIEIVLAFEPGQLASNTGDSVVINGVEVGRVKQVELRQGPPPGHGAESDTATWRIYVHALASVRGDVPLYADVQGRISQSITGSRELRLFPGRSEQPLDPESTTARPILVRQAATFDSITAQLSDLAERIGVALDQVGAVGQDVRDLLGDARRLVQTVESKVEALDIAAIDEDVRAAAGALRSALVTLEGRVDHIAGNVAAASDDMRRMGAAGARLVEGAERDTAEVLAAIKVLVGRLDQLVAGAAPKLDALLADAGRTAANLAAFSEDVKGLGPEARRAIAAAGGDVEVLLETLNDAARNVLDASEDIRAHPWKLLNEPSADQIAYENLRVTMTAYVDAMRDMEATSQRLQAILREDAADPAVAERLRRALASFESSRERYQQTEARLLQLLQRSGERGGGGR